jgi:signal transduction histidine kinase
MQREVALPTITLGRVKWNQDVVDVAIGLVLFVVPLVALWLGHLGLDLLGLILLALQTLPVAVRRRNPMRVLLVTGVSITAYSLIGYTVADSWTGVLVAFYTVAANEPRIRATIAALVTAAGILLSFLAYAAFDPQKATDANLLATYAAFAVAWLMGDNLRVRRAYKRQLEERAFEVHRDREQQATRAVAEERARIARELHDVVAHYVSVMVVQSAGARRIAEKDPDAARAALEAVEAAGRTALAEMRRMLEVLRADDPGMGPQPGLNDLEKLIDHVRDTGLPVEYLVQGATCCLPAAMDLAAYRIVQEALTNTVKHGGRARARVTVRYLADALEIEVFDDGRGAAAPLISGTGGGHGLIGMHERVGLFGGKLQAGPVLTGGYRVFARMPIEPDDSARARTEREASLAALKGSPDERPPEPVGRHYQPRPVRKEPMPEPAPRRSLPPLIVRVVPPRPPQGRRSGRQERGDQ